jgi:hypothetical protein
MAIAAQEGRRPESRRGIGLLQSPLWNKGMALSTGVVVGLLALSALIHASALFIRETLLIVTVLQERAQKVLTRTVSHDVAVSGKPQRGLAQAPSNLNQLQR